MPLDSYHKFGSRWFCLQMVERFAEQKEILAKLLKFQSDEKLKRVFPLIYAIQTTSEALILLRQDCLLNEAHVLARLLIERITALCFELVADPVKLESAASCNEQGPASAEDLIRLAKEFRFSETYDAASLERKLSFLQSKTKLNTDVFRLAIAGHYPFASAALSGSIFGTICHLKAATKDDPEDYFQQEFATLFLSLSILMHEAIAVVAIGRDISALMAESDAVMENTVSLMIQIKDPVDANIRDSEGFWENLQDMEYSARKLIRKELSAFEKAFRLCAEAGIQVPTLAHKNRGSLRLKLTALFLKRVLNDLRGVWLLLIRGYTSQAASLAASLFENSLAARCVATNDDRASKLSKSSGELPWSKADMCKIITKEEKATGQASLPDDEGWKLLYGQYSWLCEIKHPTLHQTIYDAGATAFGKSSFAVMPLPDVREDNLGTKRLVCLICLTIAKGAITSFVRGADIQEKTSEEKQFAKKMEQVEAIIEQQLKDKTSIQVPFGIRDTHWGKKNLRNVPSVKVQ